MFKRATTWLTSSVAFVFLICVFTTVDLANQRNGKIAYTSDRDGNLEIYTMNPDGTGQARITNNPGVDDYPAWSPDGSKIAFLSQESSGTYSIKIMNPDGSGQTEVTTVVYEREDFTFNWLPHWRLSWSPEGSKLAYCEGRDIFVVNVNGTGRINLTDHASFDAHPSWSSDGSEIIFSSDRNTSKYSFQWFAMNADGSDPHQIPGGLGESFLSEIDPVRSPDGTKLAGVWVWFLDVGCFLIRDLSGNVQFIDFTTDRDSSTPAWSPDGRKVAFGSIVLPYTQYTDSDIFVTNVDGTDLTNLTNTTSWDAHPSWQPIASTASISGRVKTSGGVGLRNAVVSITDALGVKRTTTTSTFGFYSFNDIPSGVTYTIAVASRRYRFAPRSITISNDLTDIDFNGLE